jgi:predicted metal-dependent RNase
MDSTHGADPEPNLKRDRRAFRRAITGLAEFITRVAARGGSVLVPVFAMGRTQEILGILSSLIQRGRIPPLPIHISGLAHAICRIYDATRRDSVRQQPELRLGELGVKVLHPDRLFDPALLREPCILAASSGMMFPGTSSHTLAGRMAGQPEHGVAFVGYVDPSTPGHRLAQAEPGQVVDLGGDVGQVPLRCEVQRFGFTAHSRASQLVHTVETLRPVRVVLVHGDPEAMDSLGDRLRTLPTEVTVAEPGARIRF